jgi:transcriptional regulator with XRE-family HTH domain
MRVVSDLRVGRAVRALRHRCRLRQADVGARVGLSQDVVSLVERGRVEDMTVRTLRDVCRSVDADLVLLVRWHGGELDRLLDEGHASLVGAIVSLLEADGWETIAEVTYSEYGERGSIDVIGWHAATRTLLIVEVKTELTAIEETLRRHDAKVRLAPAIAAKRFGWQAASVGRLLVLPDLSTPRRRVARHEAVLGRAYALRGAACRSWLRAPRGGSGLLFVSPTSHGRGRCGSIRPKRVRRSAPGAPTMDGRS